MSKTQLQDISREIVGCGRCERLREHCENIASVKKREFREQQYWGKPVPGFGDPKARLWIIGLAPAAHGANRTGRMFTGDSSGRWLYGALFRAGFSNQPTAESRQDGLALRSVFVSSTARCAPPDNKPTRQEIESCASFLDREFKALNHVELILALGSIAFEAACRLLVRHGIDLGNPKPKFGHQKFARVGRYGLMSSYHPSRQNTQTGRLTQDMWDGVFEEAAKRLGLEQHAAGKGDLVGAAHANRVDVPRALRAD